MNKTQIVWSLCKLWYCFDCHWFEKSHAFFFIIHSAKTSHKICAFFFSRSNKERKRDKRHSMCSFFIADIKKNIPMHSSDSKRVFSLLLCLLSQYKVGTPECTVFYKQRNEQKKTRKEHTIRMEEWRRNTKKLTKMFAAIAAAPTTTTNLNRHEHMFYSISSDLLSVFENKQPE